MACHLLNKYMATAFFYLFFLLLFTLVSSYAERKIAAFIQDRLGPIETGWRGSYQPLADLLKLLQKENIVPKAAHKVFFCGHLPGLFWLFLLLLLFCPFSLLGMALLLLQALCIYWPCQLWKLHAFLLLGGLRITNMPE
mmetsp:Transcript_17116/g.39581  ORF Transcript_17116/g.39581 Transcript_17116/m.39581 type:complete len:139 (-) Transcript_17116:3873-4289(-)